jgi:YVTN family beta-propeller protein
MRDRAAPACRGTLASTSGLGTRRAGGQWLTTLALTALIAACNPSSPAPSAPSGAPSASTMGQASARALGAPPSSAPPPASPEPTSTGPVGGVYAAVVGGQIQAAWAAIPPRVYVPDEGAGMVAVVDPTTFKVIRRFKVGSSPEHITPSWDGRTLYVEDMFSNALTVIDPMTGRPTGRTIPVRFPYNLYYTLDGTEAIDVEDGFTYSPAAENGLRFYDPKTWKQLAFVHIPWAGANHLDFSADGSHLILSCEYTGEIVLVDVASRSIVKAIHVGGSSTDVRLSPDGSTVYVANQVRNGIDVLDASNLNYLKFIPLGRGAHGVAISRDATRLFVTDRLGGALSVIDLATNTLVATWKIGGSPDMIAVSPDGSQLWISNRFATTISVVSSTTGHVIATIDVGLHPHGLAYWPEPGRFSLGHNGNVR